jgi:hypothetical protein
MLTILIALAYCSSIIFLGINLPNVCPILFIYVYIEPDILISLMTSVKMWDLKT